MKMDSLELCSFKVMEDYSKEEYECSKELIIVAGFLMRKAVPPPVIVLDLVEEELERAAEWSE